MLWRHFRLLIGIALGTSGVGALIWALWERQPLLGPVTLIALGVGVARLEDVLKAMKDREGQRRRYLAAHPKAQARARRGQSYQSLITVVGSVALVAVGVAVIERLPESSSMKEALMSLLPALVVGVVMLATFRASFIELEAWKDDEGVRAGGGDAAPEPAVTTWFRRWFAKPQRAQVGLALMVMGLVASWGQRSMLNLSVPITMLVVGSVIVVAASSIFRPPPTDGSASVAAAEAYKRRLETDEDFRREVLRALNARGLSTVGFVVALVLVVAGVLAAPEELAVVLISGLVALAGLGALHLWANAKLMAARRRGGEDASQP